MIVAQVRAHAPPLVVLLFVAHEPHLDAHAVEHAADAPEDALGRLGALGRDDRRGLPRARGFRFASFRARFASFRSRFAAVERSSTSLAVIGRSWSWGPQ